MVDNVDSGTQIAAIVRNSSSAAPVKLAETSKERQVKAVTDKIEVKQPDVKITEVARDAASKLGDYEIIDARSPGRFRGEEDEPREGLRKGHIPNSKNVFFKSLLNDDQTFKNISELKQIFHSAGIDMSKPAITTCGSGVTAAVLNLALEVIGKSDHSLYDGSWTEWGMSPILPIATGDKK